MGIRYDIEVLVSCAGSTLSFVADPETYAPSLLGKATTRIVYDFDRFRRAGQPPLAAALARVTHVQDLAPGQQSQIQIGFTSAAGSVGCWSSCECGSTRRVAGRSPARLGSTVTAST